MRILRLDDVEATRLEGSRWKPIRSELEISAFGINAYVGDQGERLVGEHTEAGCLAGAPQHEELYLVMAGAARFEGEREQVEASAGTLVFFDDPSESRSAQALEQGTTVIAVGAPVGEAYEPAPWEYWFRARRAELEGDHDRARAIATECVERYPEPGRLFDEIGRG